MAKEKDFTKKFNHLFETLSSKSFLNCKILCNDVPLFIADYDISDKNQILKLQTLLIDKLAQKGIEVCNINLYDIIIEILKTNGQDDWNWLLENETTLSKSDLNQELENILNIPKYVIPKLEEKIKSSTASIIFISGIGEIYPYIRAHNVLNNLHDKIKNKPTLVFFPGESVQYSKPYSSFNLFGKMTQGNDYRAANIFEVKGVY